MKNFFEVDERGIVYQLSRFACGVAPCGGEVVYASNRSEAQNLWNRFKNGERYLKRDLWISGEPYPYRNVIHE